MSLWLHRYAQFLVLCTLFLIVAGAAVTSNEAGLSVPDWPLSYGKVMPEMKGGVFYEHGHRMVASTVGFLTVVMSLWIWRAEKRSWVRKLGFAAVLLVIAQGLLGGLTVLLQLPKAVSIAHACLAQIFFSTTVALAVFTSPEWHRGPQPVADTGWPSLRSLASVTPWFVLAQLAMGAAFRHKAAGVLPHIMGALVVMGVVLLVGVFTLVQHSQHKPLRRAAAVLLGVTGVQMMLGIAAYMVRVMTASHVTPSQTMVLFTVAHVATGAVLLAASVVLQIHTMRHVVVKGQAAEAVTSTERDTRTFTLAS